MKSISLNGNQLKGTSLYILKPTCGRPPLKRLTHTYISPRPHGDKANKSLALNERRWRMACIGGRGSNRLYKHNHRLSNGREDNWAPWASLPSQDECSSKRIQPKSMQQFMHVYKGNSCNTMMAVGVCVSGFRGLPGLGAAGANK